MLLKFVMADESFSPIILPKYASPDVQPHYITENGTTDIPLPTPRICTPWLDWPNMCWGPAARGHLPIRMTTSWVPIEPRLLHPKCVLNQLLTALHLRHTTYR